MIIAPNHSLVYDPEPLNAHGYHKTFNCLAYALGEPRLGHPWISSVGHTSEEVQAIESNDNFWTDYCSDYVTRVMGLQTVPLDRIPWDSHLIAFFTNGRIYSHAVRYGHKSECWSHKVNSGPVTNEDANGNVISRQDIFRTILKMPNNSTLYFKNMYRVPKKGIPAFLQF